MKIGNLIGKNLSFLFKLFSKSVKKYIEKILGGILFDVLRKKLQIFEDKALHQ